MVIQNYLLTKRVNHFVVPQHPSNTIGVRTSTLLVGSTPLVDPLVDTGASHVSISTASADLLHACKGEPWQWEGVLIGGVCSVRKLSLILTSLNPLEHHFEISLLQNYTGFTAHLDYIIFGLTVDTAQIALQLLQDPSFTASIKSKSTADPKSDLVAQLGDFIKTQNDLSGLPLSTGRTLLGGSLIISADRAVYANEQVCLVSPHQSNFVQPNWCYVLLRYMCDLIEVPSTPPTTTPTSSTTTTPSSSVTPPSSSTNPTSSTTPVPITSTIENSYLSIDNDPLSTHEGRVIEDKIDLIRKKRNASVVYEDGKRIVKYELTEEDQEWLRKYDSLMRYGIVEIVE